MDKKNKKNITMDKKNIYISPWIKKKKKKKKKWKRIANTTKH